MFLPRPVESLGGWHPEAAQQVKKIGAAKARKTGEEEDVAVSPQPIISDNPGLNFI